MKTVIRTNADKSVTIIYESAVAGCRVSRTFWVAAPGRYVWEGQKQVCEKLAGTGITLMASADELAAVIRREYKAMRRSEQKI